jgi:hypothetical protein
MPALPLGIGTAGPALWAGTVEYAAGIMEQFADLDTPANQVAAGDLNVGYDQVQPLDGAWRRRRNAFTEHDRGVGTGWRKLHDAQIVPGGMVDVAAPTQAIIEMFGAVDVGDRNDHKLERQGIATAFDISTAGSVGV